MLVSQNGPGLSDAVENRLATSRQVAQDKLSTAGRHFTANSHTVLAMNGRNNVSVQPLLSCPQPNPTHALKTGNRQRTTQRRTTNDERRNDATTQRRNDQTTKFSNDERRMTNDERPNDQTNNERRTTNDDKKESVTRSLPHSLTVTHSHSQSLTVTHSQIP